MTMQISEDGKYILMLRSHLLNEWIPIDAASSDSKCIYIFPATNSRLCKIIIFPESHRLKLE